MNPVGEICKAYFGLCEIRELQKNDTIVTFPVLDRFNDWMSVRISVAGDNCRISDMGFVFEDLDSAGITYTPDGKRKTDIMINTISSNLMCRYAEQDKEFYAECSLDKLGTTLLYFLQGISHLDFIAYNTQGFITSNHLHFRFSVASYFRSRGCEGYIEAPEFKGAGKLKYSFSFSMPNSALFDTLSENNANYKYAIMYKWNDVRKWDLLTYDSPLFVIENYAKNDRHKDIDAVMDENMITRISWEDKNLIDRYVIGI